MMLVRGTSVKQDRLVGNTQSATLWPRAGTHAATTKGLRERTVGFGLKLLRFLLFLLGDGYKARWRLEVVRPALVT